MRRPPPGPGGSGPAQAPSGLLCEWPDMTPGQQITAWRQLRAWVTWLHDRYELSVEDRLPRCWPLHPGRIEELWALMAWREEIYGSAQPSGQAARYWHAELRQVLHAAATVYAAGCRTGHRSAPALASDDKTLQEQWARASPLAGVPGIGIAAGHARRAGRWAATAAMAAAIDAGEAAPLPGPCDSIICAGTWWAPAASGWVRLPDPERPGLEDMTGEPPWEY